MLQLGIIGLGVIGQKHLEAAKLLPGARVRAVCDLRAGVVEETARRHAIESWTSDPAQLLADPAIDAVVLALPTQVRTQLGLEALRSGKHLLLEKPVAMNAAEVDALLAAQGGRVAACCSSRFRYFDSARAARSCLEAGTLGELRVLHCRAAVPARAAPAQPPPAWRLNRALNGGGILVNWGSYDLDYLLGLTGFQLKPRHVLARSWTIPAPFAARAAPGSDAETHVAALVTFENGAVLQYERCEFCAQPASSSWSISGDRASLTLTMHGGREENVLLTESDPEKGATTRTLWSGDESVLNVHAGPVADFVEAIVQGRPPLTGLAEARQVAAITDAIYASARLGGPVNLNEAAPP